MKRRTLLVLATVCLAVACATTVQAQRAQIKIIIEGQEVQARAIPGPSNGLPMIPAQAVLEALGVTFFFDKIGNAVVGLEGDKSLYAPIGKKDAIANGETVTAQEAPFLDEGTVYIEASLLQEAFGRNLNWKQTENVLEIGGMVAPSPPPAAATPEIRLLSQMAAEKPGQKPIRVFVDGTELLGDMAMERGRLLAPLPLLAPALRCTFTSGSPEGATAFALKAPDGTTVDLAIDSDLAELSNLPAEVAGTYEPKEVKLPTPCRLVGGDIYVPIAGLVELLGGTSLWKEEEKAVLVFTTPQAPPPPSPAGTARLMSAFLAEKPTLRPVRLTVDGVQLEGELAMEEERLLAPAAALAHALGWTAEVEGTRVTLTCTTATYPRRDVIRLEIGSSQAELAEGQPPIPRSFELVGPPRLLGEGVLYVPVAGLVEVMGATRAWDAERKTVQVFTYGVAPPEGVRPPADAAGKARLALEIGVERPPRVAVEGKELKAALAMENARLLAPIHVLAGALGWECAWRSAAEAPKGSLGVRKVGTEKWLYFAIGSDVATNGQQRRLAVPVRLLRGMVYVPVADFVEIIGASWIWDKQNKIVEIRRPVPPQAGVKVGDILASPATYEGQLVFVVGRYAGKNPPNGTPAGQPPTSLEDWLLEDGTGAIYVAYDPAGDLNLAMENGHEVAIWALVRLTTDSRPYLEPGLAGGRWDLVPGAGTGD